MSTKTSILIMNAAVLLAYATLKNIHANWHLEDFMLSGIFILQSLYCWKTSELFDKLSAAVDTFLKNTDPEKLFGKREDGA